MTRVRWAWGGAIFLLGIVVLIWLLWSAGPEPGQAGGVIQVVDNASLPVPPETSPGSAEVKRIPIVATQENVTLADEQSYRVANEKRDRDWAERSETAIMSMMRGIPYIGGSRRLAVKCAASACEVTGLADADPATGSFDPVWEALERDTAGYSLRKDGLERSSAIFDTGRNPEEFKITYRRIVPTQ